MNLEKINKLIKAEYAFFLQQKKGWSLTAGPQDLELVAHALRVLLHARTTPDFLADYLALVDCQGKDGGWSPFSADRESTVWVSAFCGLMLIRGNRLLHHERLTRSVRKAIDYFLDAQQSDGRWVDPRWADLDTTSHPVSFFNVVMALDEPHRRHDVLQAWERGARFILDRQSADGGWYDNDFHPSGVEITAHLIQDALVADLVIDHCLSGVRESCAKGAVKLYEWQAADGSWDEENVDHTMDCTRSLMVVTRILGDERGEDIIVRGLHWIIANKNLQGWGDFPGMETNLERTCDGLDTLLKYKAYRSIDPRDVVKLWGYIP
ncbi:MAG TPA: prenyltransferase/squalene oxidase repeat-containing protein [Candidatus Binatia bacterium]|jgi:squalene cyclase|nr:prenyltransferase/squalene oxidase repeat-containing protein [Candidatus Binatia bacterium]